ASRISGEKRIVPQDNLAEEVQRMLDQIHDEMFERAKAFREENFRVLGTLDEMKAFMEQKRGFVEAGWCGSEACERQVKEETGATSRNIPFEPTTKQPTCLVCGDPAAHTVVFARAY